MTLILNLPPEAEQSLHEKAARSGIAPQDYVIRLLLRDLPPQDVVQTARPLSREESLLLAQINKGTPADVWERYDALLQKRDAGTLASEEHADLIALSDRIEEENATRMENVSELARLRGTTLAALVRELGIGPRKNNRGL